MRRSRPTERKASFSRTALVFLSLVVALPFLAGSLFPQRSRIHGVQPLMCRLDRREFIYEIPAEGQVESDEAVEVCCEVGTQFSPWTMILDVIEEGTYVQPGDVLVVLDSAELEREQIGLAIRCRQSEAWLAEARNVYSTALTAQAEYLAGEFKLAEQKIAMQRMVAEEKLRKATQLFQSSRRLAEQGYISAAQLQADEFSVKSAANELKAAQINWDVLHNLTRERRLKELDSAIVVAKARVEMRENIHALNCRKLTETEEMIGKCTVRAPAAGQVMLAHLDHGDHTHWVREGETAFNKRILVRLPDPKKMQINAKIREDKISIVRPGMPAKITFEALPGVEVEGYVEKINEFPESGSWFGSEVREYKTTVRLAHIPAGLHPGLSADLEICVERRPAELLVPCQAVLKHGDKNYCITLDEQGWQAREVKLTSSNSMYAAISAGLEEGREVVLNAAAYKSEVTLPELPPS